MSRQLINRIKGRVYGWFDSKDAREVLPPVPARFTKSRLVLDHLEDRCVPATFTVLNTGDNGGVDPLFGDGTGTLRQAIVDANSTAGADVIAFGGVFGTPGAGVAGTVLLSAALPMILEDVTITGNLTSGGALVTTVSGNALVNIFNTTNAAGGAPIVFEKLIVTKGNAGTDNDILLGGAFTIGDEAVSINNCTVTANKGPNGGAIRITDVSTLAVLTITNSTITANSTTNASTAVHGGGFIRANTFNVINVTNSTISGNSTASIGGAILSVGSTVNLTNVNLTANIATNNGGGINGQGGVSTYTFTNCFINGNKTSARGGGMSITNGSTININSSIVSGNSATAVGGAFYAGNNTVSNWNFKNSTISGNLSSSQGPAFQAFAVGNMTIENSTWSGHSSPFGGGALCISDGGGANNFTSLTITNSTFSNNTASSDGGAINLDVTTIGSVTINSSTFTANKSNSATTTPGFGGGALQVQKSATTVTLNNTIMSGNISNGPIKDLSLSPNVTLIANHSAIGDSAGHTPVLTLSSTPTPGTNIDYGAKLLLSPLANNGGATRGSTTNNSVGFTVLVGAGSAAQNKGSNAFGPVLTTDQRGAGFPREIPTGSPDIGSYERALSGVPNASGGPFTNVDKTNKLTLNPYIITVTYNGDIPLAVATVDDGDEVLVTGPAGYSQFGAFNKSTPGTDANTLVVEYQVTAPVGGWQAAHNGVYTVAVQGNQVKYFDNSNAVPATTLGTFNVGIITTFTVTNTANSGAGSLRQAIIDANNSPVSADTIVFDATFNTPQSILLTSGEMAISDSVTITGPGAKLLTISGNNSSRIFNLGGTGLLTVAISGMSLTKGAAASGGAIDFGNEDLSLTDMNITNSSAAEGGAIGNNEETSGKLSLNRVNISNNSSSNRGGAIYFLANGSGTFNMRQSTITGNIAGGIGGAFYGFSWNSAGCVTNITNSTITNNSSATTGGAFRFSATAVPTLNLKSTILQGNSAGGLANDMLSGTLNTDYCAFGTAGGTIGIGTRTNDIPDNSVLFLQPLADNGGSVQTIAFLAESPLRNNGNNTGTGYFNETTDSRGGTFLREVPSGEPDIGAYERTPGADGVTGTLINVQIDDVTTNPYMFQISYSSEVNIDTTTIGDGGANNKDILVTGPNSFSQFATFVTIDDTNPGTPRVATYQITPPGGTWDFADNGNYVINVQANEVKTVAPENHVVAAKELGRFNVGFSGTYTVTNSNDSGTGSLRAAIDLSNGTNNAPDTIVFDSNFFTGSMKTIDLVTALPNLTDVVTINGPGRTLLTINGKGAVRPFDTSGVADTGTVTITNMVITNGFNGGAGGGINVAGESLQLTNVDITNCKAGDAGGISLGSGLITMDGSSIMNCTATADDGGAISVGTGGKLLIRTSTLSGNSAIGDGGAVYFLNNGSFVLQRSTISGNTANGTFGGGGVYFFGTISADGFIVSNSTIANNKAPNGFGGAFDFDTTTGTPSIRNSTIVGNEAKFGGGLGRSNGTNGVDVVSSVIAGNNATDVGSGDDLDIGISKVNASKSAIGSDLELNTINYGTQDNIAFGTNLLLGALGNNGGPTQTMKPQTGSPLLNAGVNTFPLTPDIDQIGFDRNDNSITQTDIGAVEVQSATAPVFSSFLVNQGFGPVFETQRSRLVNIVVNFVSPVDAAQFQTLGNVTLTSTAGPSIGNVINTGNGLIVSPASGPTSSITLTFANFSAPGFIDNASLADGLWTLAIGTASYTSSPGDTALRRLFGDFDNNGTVEGAIDFPAFGNDFNGSFSPPSSAFDFNNDGTVEGSIDFPAFGNNFNVTL